MAVALGQAGEHVEVVGPVGEDANASAGRPTPSVTVETGLDCRYRGQSHGEGAFALGRALGGLLALTAAGVALGTAYLVYRVCT